MKKQDLQNERLDRMGRKVLKAARLQSDEIDRIVAAPHLFNSVKTRIEAEERERRAKSFFGYRANFPVWNWQTAGAAFAVLAICLTVAVGISVYRKEGPQRVEREADAPENQSQFAPVEISAAASPETPAGVPQSQKTIDFALNSEKSVQRAVFRNKTRKLQKSAGKSNSIKQLPRTPGEEEEAAGGGGEFQPLTFAGNSGAEEDGSQIIRVELSRSSLFALGVNLPFENETEKIKTDLLVSSDGVVKGVRFAR